MNDNLETSNGIGISVVIATLGGDWIKKIIDSLLSGSIAPAEILICIPEEHAHKVAHLTTQIVKIISTESKGQVRQRAIGFSKAKCPLVLQLDDDILLEKETINRLVQYLLKLGPGNVIGPIYYGKNSVACIHQIKSGFAGLFKNLFDSVICAAPWGIKKMGTVTSIGINYGVDDRYCKSELVRTQWLPGGCVLAYKDDLILADFFPFAGKAYCEDVIHSYFRRAADNRLWVACGVRVHIEEPEPEFSKSAVGKVIQIRRYYLNLIHGPQWRLSVYELFCKIRSAVYSVPQKS